MSDNFKRNFGIPELSQKINEQIRFYNYDEFFRFFFGRILGDQNVLFKLSDLYRGQTLGGSTSSLAPFVPLPPQGHSQGLRNKWGHWVFVRSYFLLLHIYLYSLDLKMFQRALIHFCIERTNKRFIRTSSSTFELCT